MPELFHGGHIRYGKGTQGHAADIVFLLQNLGAKAGHVNIGGTLAATALAGQTAIKHLGEFFRFEDALVLMQGFGEGLALPPSCENLTQDVSTGAGGFGLVAADFESWTQRAANKVRFATVARAIALLYAAQ